MRERYGELASLCEHTNPWFLGNCAVGSRCGEAQHPQHPSSPLALRTAFSPRRCLAARRSGEGLLLPADRKASSASARAASFCSQAVLRKLGRSLCWWRHCRSASAASAASAAAAAEAAAADAACALAASLCSSRIASTCSPATAPTLAPTSAGCLRHRAGHRRGPAAAAMRHRSLDPARRRRRSHPAGSAAAAAAPWP